MVITSTTWSVHFFSRRKKKKMMMKLQAGDDDEHEWMGSESMPFVV